MMRRNPQLCPVWQCRLYAVALLMSFWCGPRSVSGFLVEDHDETLQAAISAIQELSSRLDSVVAENQQLKARLQAAEGTQSAHAQDLAQVQTEVGNLRTRSNSDFIWTEDGWALVFRGTQGIGQPLYDSWINKGHHDDDPLIRASLPCGCTTVNGSLPCDRHYRSRLLDGWPSAAIDKVRLVLYENGVEKEHVTFSGTGSDYLSWFSQSRILDSSWNDLMTATGLNFFTIAGDPSVLRRFFISHVYSGCPGDAGWLVVKDRLDDPCVWATVTHVPAFLYAPGSHDLTWDGHGLREADVLAVYVKFRDGVQLSEVCLA